MRRPGRQHEVPDQIQRETGLADGGACRQNEHFTGFQTAGVGVELRVAGRNADFDFAVVDLHELAEFIGDDILHFDVRALLLVVADLVDIGFDLFDQLPGVGVLVVAFQKRLAADIDHFPESRVFTENQAPRLDVDRG